MIEREEEGSLYDQFSGHQAPTIEQKPVREHTVNQFANRPDMSKPYVNSAPDHSSHYERKEQKNESKMSYWRLYTQQMPKGEFEQNVNNSFGGREAMANDYRGKMSGYISLYKKMMHEWNNQ